MARRKLYGYSEIKKFRVALTGWARASLKTVISTRPGFAMASTLFHRATTGKIGRQTQTWVRFETAGGSLPGT
jgi:hypothetical protein